MGTPTVGSTVRALITHGDGEFTESTYQIPSLEQGDVLVKAVMTGVCRSDVAMMKGDFPLLPPHMHGHEGLGIVTESRSDLEPGTFVATRGEPAYADYYVARKDNYVQVPELDPKYIVEPVACGINIVLNSYPAIERKKNGKLAIIGSGFLAKIVHQTLLNFFLDFDVDVIGHSNSGYWQSLLTDTPRHEEYDVIIDISERDTVQNLQIAENGLIVMAAEKSPAITTTFGDWLWRNAKMDFPSPRSEYFLQCMKTAVTWIELGKLSVDNTWTRGYNRDTEWRQAFEDADQRPQGYNRGYIIWD